MMTSKPNTWHTQRLNYNCSKFKFVWFLWWSLYYFRIVLWDKTSDPLYPNSLLSFNSQQKPSLQNLHIIKKNCKKKSKSSFISSCTTSRSQREPFNFSLKCSNFVQKKSSLLFTLHSPRLLLHNLFDFHFSKGVNSPCWVGY